jgi:hypothetical protein
MSICNTMIAQKQLEELSLLYLGLAQRKLGKYKEALVFF